MEGGEYRKVIYRRSEKEKRKREREREIFGRNHRPPPTTVSEICRFLALGLGLGVVVVHLIDLFANIFWAQNRV